MEPSSISSAQPSSCKSSILPPKFRLKPLKIPNASQFTSQSSLPGKNEMSTATTSRMFPSNGLPSPAATASFKRPPSPGPGVAFSKRLRLTCKNMNDFGVPSTSSVMAATPSTIVAQTTPHSNTSLELFSPSNLYRQYASVGDNRQNRKASVGTSHANDCQPDTKSRALQMIRWAISCNNNLRNDYKPISILGWGGCGAVFEAKRKVDSKLVAIKIMYKSSKRIGVPTEIDILSSLTHSHIVQYLGHFEDRKAWYLVMERFGKIWKSPQDVQKECISLTNTSLIDKHMQSPAISMTGTSSSLFEYIDHSKGGKVPQRSLRPLFKQICQALVFLHDQGIIHGDLKEENILIGNVKGRLVAKLCDFGHSCRIDKGNPKMRLYGTRVLTPPEMLNHLRCEERGQKCFDTLQLGFKQDVWALGIVFWTMLHGALPVENESYIAGDFNLCDFTHYPTSFNAIDDADCLDLLKQMLCLDPEKRLSATNVLNHNYFRK